MNSSFVKACMTTNVILFKKSFTAFQGGLRHTTIMRFGFNQHMIGSCLNRMLCGAPWKLTPKSLVSVLSAITSAGESFSSTDHLPFVIFVLPRSFLWRIKHPLVGSLDFK
jgi:hypothetical protein